MHVTLLIVFDECLGFPYRRGLCEVGRRVFAFLQPPGTWGWANAGIVVGSGETLLVDTFYTLGLTRELLAAARSVSDGPVYSVVNTHLNGDHCWGNQLLPDAELLTSQRCADEAHAEVTPDQLAHLAGSSDALGAYMARHFGGFDFTGVQPTLPTRTFSGSLSYGMGGRRLELIELGPAHTCGDVVVNVPDSGVVFTGDLLFIGDHPVAWTGPLSGWIAACDRLLDLDAHVYVPGHGPVTDRTGVAEFRGYLETVNAYGQACAQAGTPLLTAAREFTQGPYATWGLPERLVTVLAAAYRETDPDIDMRPLALAKLMSALAADQD